MLFLETISNNFRDQPPKSQVFQSGNFCRVARDLSAKSVKVLEVDLKIILVRLVSKQFIK